MPLWQFDMFFGMLTVITITYNMPHFLLPLGPGIGFEGPPSSVGDGESLGRERARKTTRRRFWRQWGKMKRLRDDHTRSKLNFSNRRGSPTSSSGSSRCCVYLGPDLDPAVWSRILSGSALEALPMATEFMDAAGMVAPPFMPPQHWSDRRRKKSLKSQRGML